MKVELEPLVSAIRIWENSDAEYGDPYQWAATVRWMNSTEVEIVCVDKEITRSIWKAIALALDSQGVERVMMTRYRLGEMRTRWLSIREIVKRG